jgi:hypothetical protein
MQVCRVRIRIRSEPLILGLLCPDDLVPRILYYPEVGNVTSKCKGVTRYRFSHVLRAISIKSDNVSNDPGAVTIKSDNDIHKPWAIIIKSDSFSQPC